MGLIDKVMKKVTTKVAGVGDEYDEDAANSSLTMEDAKEMLAQSFGTTPEFREKQKKRFSEIYGREPVPSSGDPLFFDPDAKTPTRITAERLKLIITSKMAKAKADMGGKIPDATKEEKQEVKDALKAVRKGEQ